jgi:predicted GNAT superfamily acetyltransferase
MFEWTLNRKHFVVRELKSMAELHEVEDIQREVWQFSDLDVVPAATLIATQHAGGQMLGAFEGVRMIGFVYGFPAYESGRVSIHSHMLAVRAEYRNYQAGYNLKLAQRVAALARGIDEITWTYDPLQTLNAHLNFSKLGVIARRYFVNFYGEETSSPLHRGFGTDRLWVSWLLNSEHVKHRIANDEKTLRPTPQFAGSETGAPPTALVYRSGDEPRSQDLKEILKSKVCFIEIPQGINELKEREPALGKSWREATRAAFLAALDRGFIVGDLMRAGNEGQARWFYVLTRD